MVAVVHDEGAKSVWGERDTQTRNLLRNVVSPGEDCVRTGCTSILPFSLRCMWYDSDEIPVYLRLDTHRKGGLKLQTVYDRYLGYVFFCTAHLLENLENKRKTE